MTFASVLKFNPFHDKAGEFTDHAGANFISTGPKFANFMRKVRGVHLGPNKGGGYSGKVAAGITKVVEARPNKDHKSVTGVKSHTVDINPKTREEFNKAKDDVHSVLSMNGFKSKNGMLTEGKEGMRTEYDHPNGAGAVVEHMDQKINGASKFIGVEIFHGNLAKPKARSNPYARKVEGAVADAVDSFVQIVFDQVEKMADNQTGYASVFKIGNGNNQPTKKEDSGGGNKVGFASVFKRVGAPFGNRNAAGDHRAFTRGGAGASREAIALSIRAKELTAKAKTPEDHEKAGKAHTEASASHSASSAFYKASGDTAKSSAHASASRGHDTQATIHANARKARATAKSEDTIVEDVFPMETLEVLVAMFPVGKADDHAPDEVDDPEDPDGAFGTVQKGAPMGNKNAIGPHKGNRTPETSDGRGAPLQGHQNHSKSNAELKGIMRDAGEARANFPNDHPSNGKYSDQINDALTVLYHRKSQGIDDVIPKPKVVKVENVATQLRNTLGIGLAYR